MISPLKQSNLFYRLCKEDRDYFEATNTENCSCTEGRGKRMPSKRYQTRLNEKQTLHQFTFGTFVGLLYLERRVMYFGLCSGYLTHLLLFR